MSKIVSRSRSWPKPSSRSLANVDLAYVDQGYTGEAAQQSAASHGIELAVVKHTQAKRGFVRLPVVGLSSVALPGRRASDASPATTNNWRKPWQDGIMWPSYASCSLSYSGCPTKGNNRL
jgi:hypothetical protein